MSDIENRTAYSNSHDGIGRVSSATAEDTRPYLPGRRTETLCAIDADFLVTIHAVLR